MSKIYLNESHIRQLVKETLESLILGEDDIEGGNHPVHTLDEYMYILANTEIDKYNWEINQDESNIDRDGGCVEIVTYGDDFDFIALKVYFNMDVTYIPYNGGNYWTPPEGGYHECDSFEIINIEYNMNDEYNGSLKQKPEGLEEFIYQYVMEEIDEKYDEESYMPDPDFEYDSRKNDF